MIWILVPTQSIKPCATGPHSYAGGRLSGPNDIGRSCKISPPIHGKGSRETNLAESHGDMFAIAIKHNDGKTEICKLSNELPTHAYTASGKGGGGAFCSTPHNTCKLITAITHCLLR